MVIFLMAQEISRLDRQRLPFRFGWSVGTYFEWKFFSCWKTKSMGSLEL
jgi:hypothetical protein